MKRVRLKNGAVYGKLTVEYSVNSGRYRCKCVCGNVRDFTGYTLTSGRRSSCGCAQKKHGLRNTRTWHSWRAMRQRCYLPKSRSYKDYGGRGITVYQPWRDSFTAFVDDMGVAPDDHTIDRIDVNGNYEPGNCKWSTAIEQAANKRSVQDARSFSDDLDYEDPY